MPQEEMKGQSQSEVSKIHSKNSKICFYENALNETELMDFKTAFGMDGIDDEIAIFRVKVKMILENDPDDIKLLTQTTEALIKMVKARYAISKGQKKNLREAINNIIKDIAVPLGVAIITKK